MEQFQRLLAKICREIGTPLALKSVLPAVERGEWPRLQKLELSPFWTYGSAHALRQDRLLADLIRKAPLPGHNDLKAARALEIFFAGEAQCHRTNGYIRHLTKGHLDRRDMAALALMREWRAAIRRVLGPLPRRLSPGYSPGATLSDAGKAITIPDKMSSYRSCYSHSIAVVNHSIDGTELDRLYEGFKYPRANRYFTVPKDSEKDRNCAVEASMNISLQLAVGKEIRRRYNKYYQVDLSHLQAAHRAIAKMASVTGSHATVDLSNASDTVARELVRSLLPTDWCDLLNSLRATHTQVKGKTLYLEKFSSMGNGFTFELETLLFRTLCEAIGAGRDDATCYGDDIIVPTGLAPKLLTALHVFGFSLNEKKSFCDGPFRESCGGDYYEGTDVRPPFIKEFPDEPQKWVVLHNQLYAWGLRASCRLIVDYLPSQWRNYVPPGFSDYALWSDDAEMHRRYDKKASTYYYTSFEPIHRKIDVSYRWFNDKVVIAAALYGISPRLALRDSVMGYKRTRIPAYGLSDDRLRIWLHGGDLV